MDLNRTLSTQQTKAAVYMLDRPAMKDFNLLALFRFRCKRAPHNLNAQKRLTLPHYAPALLPFDVQILLRKDLRWQAKT